MIRQAYLVFSVDTGSDDDFIQSVLLPGLRALPGIRRLEAGTVTERPFGTLHVNGMIDAWFDSEDDLNKAMSSTEGKALARSLAANPRAPIEILVLRQEA